MKEASPYACPVCNIGTTWQDYSHMDHTLMEAYEWCDCGAYRYEYVTGNTAWWVGPVELSYSYVDAGSVPHVSLQAAIRRGRRQDRGLLAACRAAPGDQAPRLILADWCDENDMSDWAGFWRGQARRLADEQVTGT